MHTERRVSSKSPSEAGVSRWNTIFSIRPLLPALEIKYSASLIWRNPHCFRFDRVQMAPRDILCLPFLLLFFASHTCKASKEPLVSRIAFGSCANQSAPQPIWNAVIDFDPQLFIWLGDNIYGDTRQPFKLFGKERTIGPWKNAPRFVPATEPELQFRFNKAKNNPGYSRLRERSLVVGTWDDHDYGLNDAGKEFSGKNISQRLLLDFLDEAQDSARRKQAGVYASYMFGPEGKQIKVAVPKAVETWVPLVMEMEGDLWDEWHTEGRQQEAWFQAKQVKKPRDLAPNLQDWVSLSRRELSGTKGLPKTDLARDGDEINQ